MDYIDCPYGGCRTPQGNAARPQEQLKRHGKMKRLLILAAMAVLAFGCTGPRGPQGPQGPAGESAMSYTFTYDLASQDWVMNTDAGGNFIGWWHEITLPELTRYVYDYGMYTTYLVDGNIQVPLPLIVYNETDGTLWERKISCDYAVGSVAVYYQENDFTNEGYRPESMTFRIKLVW